MDKKFKGMVAAGIECTTFIYREREFCLFNKLIPLMNVTNVHLGKQNKDGRCIGWQSFEINRMHSSRFKADI